MGSSFENHLAKILMAVKTVIDLKIMFSPQSHPKQLFLFFVEDELNINLAEKMQALIERLADEYSWIINAPTYCDEFNVDLDKSVPAIGGIVEIFSALPPEGENLPYEVDLAHFKEIQILIESLERYSKETKSTIALELDDVQIGWIENGVSDSSIKKAFLEEWKRELDEKAMH